MPPPDVAELFLKEVTETLACFDTVKLMGTRVKMAPPSSIATLDSKMELSPGPHCN